LGLIFYFLFFNEIKEPWIFPRLFCFHAPTQLVAPSAVRIAVAIEAINCTINFAVSFLDITS
jgi:hypothetical protein